MNSKEQPLPEVCISNFMVKYFPKKELDKINHRIEGIAKRAANKHIKYFKISSYTITLNSNNEFPTEATKDRILRSVWKYSNAKGKYEDHVVTIQDVEVKGRSGISYEFDYKKN